MKPVLVLVIVFGVGIPLMFRLVDNWLDRATGFDRKTPKIMNDIDRIAKAIMHSDEREYRTWEKAPEWRRDHHRKMAKATVLAMQEQKT